MSFVATARASHSGGASKHAHPGSWVLPVVATSVSGLAGDKVLCEGGAGVHLAHQAGEEQHRAAWPVVHHEVLGLPGGIPLNRYHDAGWLALDATGILLEKAVVAIVACKLELLVLIQLASIGHELMDALRPL